VILMKYSTVSLKRRGRCGLVSGIGANLFNHSQKSFQIQSIGVLSCLKTISLSHYAT
jgi:hypothetical protein